MAVQELSAGNFPTHRTIREFRRRHLDDFKRLFLGVVRLKAQSNFADSESRIMKTSSEGFQQCYNKQLGVDGEWQLIVVAEVTANASGQG